MRDDLIKDFCYYAFNLNEDDASGVPNDHWYEYELLSEEFSLLEYEDDLKMRAQEYQSYVDEFAC